MANLSFLTNLWGAVTGFDALDLQVHGPSTLE
jgi:hypothetical protein